MKTSDFFYDLPEKLIAQTPIEPRDSSRLLCFDKKTKKIAHKRFKDIVDYLKEGDVLVINNTKVLPARLFSKKKGTGGQLEILLLKRRDINTWEVLTKPGRIAKTGSEFVFSEELSGTIIDDSLDGGLRLIKFSFDGVFEEIIDKIGIMPLPHYIKETLKDNSRYQTVYAKIDGSSAAPTAGLHFTKDLLKRIREKGVIIKEVDLHVGLGTFRPVKVANINEHIMHKEYFEISDETAEYINKAKKNGQRIIAVGTTSVRVLESAADNDGMLHGQCRETDIFIYPGYDFKIVDCLITNFHLPESTLIMLVSAFAGYDETMNIYNTAVKEEYRFFSFGDAMFLY